MTRRTCVTCGRDRSRTDLVFVMLEEDGCGEYECKDRASCIKTRQDVPVA